MPRLPPGAAPLSDAERQQRHRDKLRAERDATDKARLARARRMIAELEREVALLRARLAAPEAHVDLRLDARDIALAIRAQVDDGKASRIAGVLDTQLAYEGTRR